MKISLMTWNTELYVYGNEASNGTIMKPLEEGRRNYLRIKDTIRKHLDNSKGDHKAIVVLQEIPYKSNTDKCNTKKWQYHELFEKFKKDFSTDYDIVYYGKSKEDMYKARHIKMTVIIASKDTISECRGKNNIYIPFTINELNIKVLALHAHDAFETRNWLSKNQDFKPNIMIGDFNAGNYKKSEKDNEIAINRKNYLSLTEGYIDACQGKYTFKHKTQIDHILLENFGECKFKYENIFVDYEIDASDHYPVYCDLIFGNNK